MVSNREKETEKETLSIIKDLISNEQKFKLETIYVKSRDGQQFRIATQWKINEAVAESSIIDLEGFMRDLYSKELQKEVERKLLNVHYESKPERD